MTQHHHITPELIRAALAHLSAAISREEWARVAMAIKSEYPDDTGFELFDAWSQTAGDGYNARDTRDTWRSIKAGGPVRIGTLLYLAKQNGFELPRSGEAPSRPDPEALARQARERQQRDQAEAARIAAEHERAAKDAAALWEAGSETGASPYLARKGVQAHGVRYQLNGTLLVPMRDEADRLWNVQRIAPERPKDGPEKRSCKGGRKSGLWHLLGEAPDGGGVLLLAEGYSTAASLHEATAYPVAVGFDAGNLPRVAKALRQLYPAALIVVCGDDDRDTAAAKDGRNTGRDKASEAARAVNGLALVPAGLPPGKSDFNDLHAHHGGPAGLAAVRETVQAAIDAHRAAQASESQPRTRQAPAPAGAGAGGPAGDSQAAGAAAPDWDRFSVEDAGVFHAGVDKEGNPTKPEWVCSRLDIEALTRDQDGQGWGYLLAFADPLARPKSWAMPARMLSGDGGEYRGTLLNMGLRIAPSTRARNLLTQYIQTRQPADVALCTEKTGWHGRAFVLPHETIGQDDAGRIVFQTDSAQDNTYRTKGTPEQWRERVAGLCVGNSRLAFAVACAFAGPLLRPAGVESGGFHFRGDSSSGKTTALKLAASVWGGSSYLQRWRTTDNALEAIAAQHNDGLLILDELAQVDPKTAGECAYMLANEQSKARATRNGAPRPRLSWRLLFLSAGELGLADHMAEGMKRTRTGQEVRMADIPADAGAGMGAFERLHGQDGGAAFSTHATGQAATVYGSAGRAWLEWLTEHAATLKGRMREAMEQLSMDLVPEAASGQVYRVGARFALVGAAGELATEAGLTGWPQGESERAARACFNAWLAARGGTGNGEVTAMLRQVRRFLEAHGEGRFVWWHRAADDHNAKTLHRIGFRRMVNEKGEPIKTNADHQRQYGETMQPFDGESTQTEYFILPEGFRSEVCQGFDPEAVCKILKAHGCLVSSERDRYTYKARLPGLGGKGTNCYRIPPTIFDLEL